MKKYEFTGVEQVFYGITLKQIRRISDGLIGGWIEKEENLSQEGNCFVYQDAKVYGNAYIFGNTYIYGNAEISGNIRISGNAVISGDVKITKPGDYLNLTGLPYNVTIFHNRTMRIGCMLKTFDEWRNFEDFERLKISKEDFNLMKKAITPNLTFWENHES